MEERRLAEPDRIRDLAEADAGKAAAREELLGSIENLLARRALSGDGSHFPTDRSVEAYRSVGRMSRRSCRRSRVGMRARRVCFQPALGIDGRHAAGSRGGDRLAVDVIL